MALDAGPIRTENQFPCRTLGACLPRTFGVDLAEDVKQKMLHVVVHGLVVQEQFGQEAQVLTVQAVIPARDLKHADPVGLVAVDLVPWGMPEDRRRKAQGCAVKGRRVTPTHRLATRNIA